MKVFLRRKAMPVALALFFCFKTVSAQPNYSSLFLANQNSTGVTQTPLSLGNWNGSQTTVPSFYFNTSDNGTSYLDIHSTRWGSAVSFTRDDQNGSHNLMSLFGANGQSALLSLYNTSNQVTIQFSGAGTSYFTGGSVAIGTTNPGSNQLAVQGTIAANKVIVTLQSPFPDYVFDRGYSLPPLDSLSVYIRAHHHLPDLPTADTVNKNGLDLGSNQTALVKKIEELTLYVIRQNKETQALKEKIKTLEERDRSLENLVKRIEKLEEK